PTPAQLNRAEYTPSRERWHRQRRTRVIWTSCRSPHPGSRRSAERSAHLPRGPAGLPTRSWFRWPGQRVNPRCREPRPPSLRKKVSMRCAECKPRSDPAIGWTGEKGRVMKRHALIPILVLAALAIGWWLGSMGRPAGGGHWIIEAFPPDGD